MKLNDLESKFFDRILNAKLDVPVHAVLECVGQTFDVIIVPEIDRFGDFTLKYYNATPSKSATQSNESGKRKIDLTTKEAGGLHPSLERAWIKNEPITIQILPSGLPVKPVPPPKLDATVLHAQYGYRGSLSLDKNQVTVQQTPLKMARFSVTSFPDFAAAPSRHIDLKSGDGWQVTILKDSEHTRDIISHTGSITKIDGSEFETNELVDVLQRLKYFFAFVSGAYRFPTVVIGYASRSRPVWGEIGRFELNLPASFNWFNYSSTRRLGAYLEDLFPKFWRKWKDNKNEIIAIIECYVHSIAMRNVGIPQDAVAKSYLGLELLASLMLQKNIFGNSADQVHEVLSSHNIPNRCLEQNETPLLRSLGTHLGKAETRGAPLLGRVRNYVAHPLRRKTPVKIKASYINYLDADPAQYAYLHDLSQFYLEYMLLKFCNYAVKRHRPLLESLQNV